MIPDNYEMLRRHEERQARRMLRYPMCSVCEERIMDDHLFEVNGELFCEVCMKESFQQDTDLYILEDDDEGV